MLNCFSDQSIVHHLDQSVVHHLEPVFYCPLHTNIHCDNFSTNGFNVAARECCAKVYWETLWVLLEQCAVGFQHSSKTTNNLSGSVPPPSQEKLEVSLEKPHRSTHTHTAVTAYKYIDPPNRKGSLIARLIVTRRSGAIQQHTTKVLLLSSKSIPSIHPSIYSVASFHHVLRARFV